MQNEYDADLTAVDPCPTALHPAFDAQPFGNVRRTILILLAFGGMAFKGDACLCGGSRQRPDPPEASPPAASAAPQVSAEIPAAPSETAP